MSLLFPEGIDHLADLPYPLHQALLLGLRWLHFDELEDEAYRPPKRIWLEPEPMAQWWKDVQRKREAKWKGQSTDDGDDGYYEDNDVPLIARG